MNRIRILIVDDHEVVRLGLRALIESDASMEVASEAGTAQEALDSVERCKPDIVILDIRLPDGDGLDVCRDIRRRYPDTKVIILTSYIQKDLVSEAIRCGANGYVVKDVGNEKLLQAIYSAYFGETVLDAKSVTRLAEQFRKIDSQLEAFAFKDLSHREMDVLRVLARGKSNRQIGSELNLSEVTVRNYVSTIFNKLGMSNRIELALYAVKHKLHDYPQAGEDE